MSTYEVELEDHEVRDFINDLRNGLGGQRAEGIASQIEQQAPISEPTKIGAVVVNEHHATMVLANPGAASPWWNNAQKVWSETTGRITEVPSEGVDL